MARILVVEDEFIVGEDLRACLEELGHEAWGPVATGEDAIARARELQPELVLMDIALQGDMDGVQAAEALQVDGETPVVFLTAHADRATLDRARGVEPYGYLTKPFEAQELHASLEMALYKAETQRKLRALLAEREALVLQLEHRLAQVKEISGLIPICAHCKRIRDDAGFWTAVEVWVRDHSQAEFSHSLCPTCVAELYPDELD